MKSPASHRPRKIGRKIGLLTGGLLILAACGDDHPAEVFPPYQFADSGQIHLNAATLDVHNDITPGSVPGDISERAPISPVSALHQLAYERLAASGASGTAVFNIRRASILHDAGGMLHGEMDVRLSLTSADGQSSGQAEAHVTRNMLPPMTDGDTDSPAALYNLTKQMTDDMNTELETQIRHHLSHWLVDAGGTPTGAAIESSTLTPPDGSKAATAAGTGTVAASEAATPDSTPPADTPAATAAPASQEPDAIFPTGLGSSGSDAAPVKKMSPPAGVLKLPAKTSSPG
ncbi:hypothetical protein LOC54_00145 [Acetobacter sp. AN02]|uniref:hypothetical protein n=1 Tax=Acetobacter sp. AN02 TaxID=2894186 RepID=UPI0024343FD5|nr:hypothetical protein [Acetobacter sp. AN02]MDG6093536.1 hypothetical protein [Acetobacter sp. AN02]